MFYSHNKTFWYQFCHFYKHFLKAEISEDTLASSCEDEEFCISFPVTLYETGLLLELSACSTVLHSLTHTCLVPIIVGETRES